MSLIINEQAMVDFAADGISTSLVMSSFNTLMSGLSAIVTFQSMVFDKVDPSMPTDLNETCQSEWSASFNGSFEASNTSTIDSLNITCFKCIYDLLSYAPSTTTSYQDIVEQLTSTLASYNITAVNDFFTSMIS